MSKPTKIAFEQEYSDGSGVEFGVYYDALSGYQPLTITAVDEADFPIEQIDWLIASLTAIRDAVATHDARTLLGGTVEKNDG